MEDVTAEQRTPCANALITASTKCSSEKDEILGEMSGEKREESEATSHADEDVCGCRRDLFGGKKDAAKGFNEDGEDGGIIRIYVFGCGLVGNRQNP